MTRIACSVPALTMALMLSAQAVSAADLIVGTHRIPLSAASQPVVMNTSTAQLTVYTAATQGLVGDGWCPTDRQGATTITGPTVQLRLPDNRTHLIALAEGKARVLPNGDVWVQPLENQGAQGDGWCPVDGHWSTTLRADRSLMYRGRSVALTWAVVGAQSCDTEGSVYPNGVSSVAGWMGTLPTQATNHIVTLTVDGNYTLRLNCAAANGDRYARYVQVTVIAPPECTGVHAPPAGWVRATSFVNTAGIRAGGNQDWPLNAVLDLTQWNPPAVGQLNSAGVNVSVLGPFGRSTGETAMMPIPAQGYLAFRLDTGGHANKVGIISSEQPADFAAPLQITISPCPGDFAPDQVACRSDFGLAGIGWRLTPAFPATYCPMVPGLDYYVNVAFRYPETGESFCQSAECYWLMHQVCTSGCN